MGELINKFSLREILQTFIPGFFFVIFSLPIIPKIMDIGIIWDIYDIFLICIISSFCGILLRSIDIPKRLAFFKNELPTKKLEEEFPNKKKSLVANYYYKFYDNSELMPLKDKEITEKYTNYYHYCVNMVITSLFLEIIYTGYILFSEETFIQSYGFPILLILILSLLSIVYLFWGNRKIKFRFERDLGRFKNSSLYNELKESE